MGGQMGGAALCHMALILPAVGVRAMGPALPCLSLRASQVSP